MFFTRATTRTDPSRSTEPETYSSCRFTPFSASERVLFVSSNSVTCADGSIFANTVCAAVGDGIVQVIVTSCWSDDFNQPGIVTV